MTKRVADLTGAELDYWVAKACGYDAEIRMDDKGEFCRRFERMEGGSHCIGPFFPSSQWVDGGPIIERENIQLTPPTSKVHRNGGPNAGWGPSGLWSSVMWERGENGRRPWAYHETSPLIAAMRCYVASKFGETVEE